MAGPSDRQRAWLRRYHLLRADGATAKQAGKVCDQRYGNYKTGHIPVRDYRDMTHEERLRDKDTGLTVSELLRTKKALDGHRVRTLNDLTKDWKEFHEFLRPWHKAVLDSMAFGEGVVFTTDVNATANLVPIQQKENSNMSNTNTPAPEYSKNCAIATLQKQLEKAQENTPVSERNLADRQALLKQAQANVDYWTESLANDHRREKELKAALKKLGAGPRVTA